MSKEALTGDRFEAVARYVEENLLLIYQSRGSISNEDIQRVKLSASKKFNLGYTPSNAALLPHISNPKIRDYLLMKPVRSISGIVILAIMTAPFECPHGRCIYCPHVPGAPISYTGKEPSAMRGINFQFDPYEQIKSRIRQLEAMGHYTDKVDIVIQGGTFNQTPSWYKESYMKRLFEFFIGDQPKKFPDDLIKAERSRYRIVGLAFETKPDASKKDDIDWMLEHGGTRVELGIQTLYNDVYRFVNRGHNLRDVIEATTLLKDAGFKVTYHIMPGLPLTSIKEDLQVFEKIFTSYNYMPDHLKIYPTLVLEHTGLIKLWERGEYKPLSTEEALNLIKIVKSTFIPTWNRIMRINRDIPSTEVIDGVKKPNLRQLVHAAMDEHGIRCRCIRCREIGHNIIKKNIQEVDPQVIIRKYNANGGLEFFISVEDPSNDLILGFIRLRKPSPRAWRPEIISAETFLVRELHVYGRSLPIGGSGSYLSWQHRGIGAKLLNIAEEITSSMGGDKIVVISGVGVREYYYRLGYQRDGPYVSKVIK
ncbi:TPA: tRNA uridine(34) 5-carboxymethylaminomethyl modification radical SAM/GNAT enzyme Elp3 [Candidatus Geothermarchaeota archaeon]|nr:tRNA uridine(34) 5-carboxymethylaminomethyl modification radical SAM/GNAT enzyme Elp3 [Candidatus Geothermarchaeota archaeon]HIQ13224.1 tRNA uridine(34) 5-carboxymethylaminomethyl modification radical SAM/GNAT enzyme Elp3 [Thermoprotei archaeon]